MNNDTKHEAQGLDEVPCSTNPDAPHGFNRDSSHSLDRYVCDCEGWVPPVQEAPQPVSDDALPPLIKTLRDNGDLIAARVDIAQLKVENERLASELRAARVYMESLRLQRELDQTIAERAANPFHGMYQDADGTIPVTVAGQPVSEENK